MLGIDHGINEVHAAIVLHILYKNSTLNAMPFFNA